MFASFRRFGKSAERKQNSPLQTKGSCLFVFATLCLSYYFFVVVINLCVCYSQNWSQVHATAYSMFFCLNNVTSLLRLQLSVAQHCSVVHLYFMGLASKCKPGCDVWLFYKQTPFLGVDFRSEVETFKSFDLNWHHPHPEGSATAHLSRPF